MNVVIIEDEPLISENLKSILTEIDDSISVLKTISSVKESVAWLKENQSKCDFLMVDIHLADGYAFEIFKEVESNTPIIFITSYDKYALEAFNVQGVDYILKPFDKIKIKKSLDKFKSLTKTNSNTLDYESFLKILNSKTSSEGRKSFLVYYQEKLIPLAVNSISFFYKKNQITYATKTNNKTYVIDNSLDEIQGELSSVDFYRANRQFIIQRSAIENITFYFNGRLIVNILPKPDDKIIVSKAKATEFKKWLDQNHSDGLVKNYRGYVDDITDGAVIRAKKLIKDGEDTDKVIAHLAESLKNKLTHETTTKLKEVLSLIDDKTALKIQKIFKEK